MSTRDKATSFERVDFLRRPPTPLPSDPPATSAEAAGPTPPTPKPPVEVALPDRLDVHGTGRPDSDFIAHQRGQPLVALVAALVFLTTIGLITIAVIGVGVALWFGGSG